jgi:hypothetical protein
MTTQGKQRLVEMARKRGMTDADILREVLSGVYGSRRRELVVEWGVELGLSSSDALRLAYSVGLLPSVHSPRKPGRETPPDRDPESTSR